MKNHKSIEIAKMFCRLLIRDVGPFLVEAVQRNRDEESPGVCHTHDFCDANMTMAEAMQAHGLMADKTVPLGDQDNDVWNEAWDLAKKAEFDAERVTSSY
jgi:hypothetical protein